MKIKSAIIFAGMALLGPWTVFAQLPPTVDISNPMNGQTFPFMTAVPASATVDGAEEVSVAFYLDGNCVASVTSPPYTAILPGDMLPIGDHLLVAFATNSLGQVGKSESVMITIIDGGANLLNVVGSYNGMINGEPVTGTSMGQLDPKGLVVSHIDIDFSAMPVSHHPFALGASYVTIVCGNACMREGSALNLFDLSGGNYTLERTFSWPEYPGSSLSVTGWVETTGNVMNYGMTLLGTYEGPVDLVGVSDYRVRWQPGGMGTMLESGSATIHRADGSSFQVQLQSVYRGLSMDLPGEQTGWITAVGLNFDPAMGHYHIDWTGEMMRLATVNLHWLAGEPRLLEATWSPPEAVLLGASQAEGPWEVIAYNTNRYIVTPPPSQANPLGFFKARVPTMRDPVVWRVEPAVIAAGDSADMIHIFGGPFGTESQVYYVVGGVTNVAPSMLNGPGELIVPGLPGIAPGSSVSFFITTPGGLEVFNERAGTIVAEDTAGGVQKEPPGKAPATPITTTTTKPGDRSTVTKGPPPSNPTDPIYLHNGEFHESVVDLRIPGRGLDFIWERKYRSRLGPSTAQGNGWDFSYNVYIQGNGPNVEVCNGNTRRDVFYQRPGGIYSRREFFQEGHFKADGEFVLEFADKGHWTFGRLDGSMQQGRLRQSTDHNGNSLRFAYDVQGRLTNIWDTLGRRILVEYNSQGLIQSVTDFTGRRVSYAYWQDGELGGSAGDLKSVTDPLGNTTTYTYSMGFADLALNHNLLTITGPNGQTYLSNSYGTTPGNPEYDRVVRQVWGSPSEVICISYVPQSPHPMNQYALMKAIVNDRVGNVVEYLFDSRNRCVREQFWTGRALPGQAVTETQNRPTGKMNPADPDYFETRREYNDDSKLRRLYNPNGTVVEYYHEADLNTGAAARQRGNMRIRCDWPGVLPSDQTVLVYHFEYDTGATSTNGFNGMTRQQDTLGRVTHFQYDSAGNQILEIDPMGSTRAWTYSSAGQLVSERDKNGFVTRYYYDVVGNRTNVTDPLGQVTLYTFDALGNRVARVDANYHTNRYAYDLLGRLVSDTDALGGVTQHQYDREGNRIRTIDANNHRQWFGYDVLGRLVAQTNEIGGVKIFAYDGNGNLTTETDENGNMTWRDYDELNRLIRITNPLGCVRSRAYDAVGNVVAETYEGGFTTLYSYDAWNRPIQKVDPLGNVTQYSYIGTGGISCCGSPSASSRLAKLTDANGKITYYKYDALDRLLIQVRKTGDVSDAIDPSDAVSRYTYDPNGNLLSVTEPNGLVSSKAYDALNRVTNKINGAGERMSYSYDGVGNVRSVTLTTGNVVTNFYDANNRVLAVQDTLGPVKAYTYDAVGNRLTEADGNMNTTIHNYDGLNRVVQTTDPNGGITMFTYDAVGNLVRVTDRMGQQTIYTYDGMNRAITKTDHLGNVSGNSYDCAGNLIAITDANNHTTFFHYDAMKRLMEETYPDPAPNCLTYSYDPVGNRLSRTGQNGATTVYTYNELYQLVQRSYPTDAADNFLYDLSGRMLWAEKGGWVLNFTYDGADRIIETSQGGHRIQYTYDTAGRNRTITYPGNRIVDEIRDVRGRLSHVDDGAGGGPLCTYTYDLGDRVRTRSYRNGVSASYAYDGNNWLMDLQHVAGADTVAGFSYAYDAEGHKLCELPAHDPLHAQQFIYDALYRLTDFAVGQAAGCSIPNPAHRTIWQLDPVGNWLSKTVDGIIEFRTHNDVNEITDIGAQPVQHDPNGNLSDDGLHSYVYDDENRLAQVTRIADGQVVARYSYDPLGRRIGKTVQPDPLQPARSTVYLHDGLRVIEELDEANGSEATYVYGTYIDEVLQMQRGASTLYYHQNAQWSVAAVTDATGALRELVSYDAHGTPSISDHNGTPIPSNSWGTPHSGIGNPVLFTGRTLDEESGLYYFRARQYDAAKGRFSQRDPLRYADSFNLYFASFIPNLQDPLGLATVTGCTEGGHTHCTINPEPACTGRATKTNEVWTLSTGGLGADHIVVEPNRTYTVRKDDGTVVVVTCTRLNTWTERSRAHENAHRANCANKIAGLNTAHCGTFGSAAACEAARRAWNTGWNAWIATEATHSNPESPEPTDCQSEYTEEAAAGNCGAERPVR